MKIITVYKSLNLQENVSMPEEGGEGTREKHYQLTDLLRRWDWRFSRINKSALTLSCHEPGYTRRLQNDLKLILLSQLNRAVWGGVVIL